MPQREVWKWSSDTHPSARGFFRGETHASRFHAPPALRVLSRSFRCHAGPQPPWQRNAYEAFNSLDFASTVVPAICA
jgi:hypothetical protein